jgi:Family of unknown function (DUF5908)
MPIEVRELVIRARVEDQQPSTALPAGNTPQQNLTSPDLQKIIMLCSEEVMKILKRQKER